MCDTSARKKNSHDAAAVEVSQLVYAKWYHNTVYCQSQRTILRKVKTLWNDFREGKKIYQANRSNTKVADKYKNIYADAKKLFEVHTHDEEPCKTEWRVKMTERERVYYQNMKKRGTWSLTMVLIPFDILP